MFDASRGRGPALTAVVASVALLAAAACGQGRGERAAPAALDCAGFAAHVQRCAADFWSAYAVTDRARENAAPGDLAAHVGEVRATFEAVGLERMCENERRVHGDEPAWTRAVGACEAESGCPAWAGCAAPALFAGPPAR